MKRLIMKLMNKEKIMTLYYKNQKKFKKKIRNLNKN